MYWSDGYCAVYIAGNDESKIYVEHFIILPQPSLAAVEEKLLQRTTIAQLYIRLGIFGARA